MTDNRRLSHGPWWDLGLVTAGEIIGLAASLDYGFKGPSCRTASWNPSRRRCGKRLTPGDKAARRRVAMDRTDGGAGGSLGRPSSTARRSVP
jgi:hypothetical protein